MTAFKPVTLGLAPSFGFGDRIGLATPGHVEALRRAGGDIQPVFAQQSIREMTRTNRSPTKVMADALAGMKYAKWDASWGADADHLKTSDDVNRTHEVGFTFFTIDPSDHVDRKADDYDELTLRDHFAAVRADVDWYDACLNKSVTLPNDTRLVIDEQAAMRCAVKYGRAIRHALQLADHIRQVNDDADTDYEIELSIDETDQPTTPAEHYIIASQCIRHGVKLVSLAPRFPGNFEKGVDYIGDLAALEQSLADHAAVARLVGPYKLSLHSGSDKLSMYPAFARATQGLFHVKTAGTSYLEALRVAAIHDPALFRAIIDFARQRYDTDRATYHVHATLAAVPAPADVSDDLELQRIYLERWEDIKPSPYGGGMGGGASDYGTSHSCVGFTAPGRQILHCTFGSVLTHETLGRQLRRLLESNLKTYTEALAVHFARHLAALTSGLS